MEITINKQKPSILNLNDLESGDLFLVNGVRESCANLLVLTNKSDNIGDLICIRLVDGHFIYLSGVTRVKPLNDHLLTVEYK